MAESPSGMRSSEVVVGREGRVLIPAQLRRDLHLAAGSRLLVYVEDGRLVMESPEQLMDRVRREVAQTWQGDPGASAADELIADRRAEAADEESP